MDQGSFLSHDGLALVSKSWHAADPKADIAFAHGFFEHCGRYANEASAFNAAGYHFHSYDQRTHGLSEGKRRSYVTDFEDYLKDYRIFLDQLNLGKERPYFLMAHSMGGLVTCSHLIDTSAPTEMLGVILSAPLLQPDKDTAPLLQKISGLVGTLMPALKVIAIDPHAVSRDPDKVKAYVDDPLNYTDKMYAASGYHLLRQMRKIESQLNKIKTPLLIMHGTDDKLAELQGSQLLYASAKSTDKEFVQLKNYKHEITKDVDHEVVLDTMIKWMDERM